jgi:CRP-like cAMP-binding protein/Zn-dependent protease
MTQTPELLHPPPHSPRCRIVLAVATDVFAALERALDPSAQRPRLAPDIELARFTSRWQGAHAVIHNPRADTYVRLSGAQAQLAASLDGSRSVSELMVAALADTGIRPDLTTELVACLYQKGFLTTPWVDTYALICERIAPRSARLLDRTWQWMRTATIQLPGAPRFVDALYTAGGRLLFSAPAQIPLALVLLAGAAAFTVELHAGSLTMLTRPTAAAASAVLVLGLVALFLHELAHALAIRHAGRRVLGAGFQLYLANPAFFINSSDMVMSGRKQRAVNAIAGPYAEAVVAGAAALGAAALSGHTALGAVLFRFAGLSYVFILINLVPFVELDGYWLLTDLLDLPDLRPRALAFVRQELPDRIRSRHRLTRGEWGLTLFGLIGALTAIMALLLAWIFWSPVLWAVATGAWQLGLAGQVLLVLLAILILGPITHGLGDSARGLRPWVRARLRAARFRMQRGWRVEAAAMIAALPRTADLTAEDLNDLAGRVHRRRFSPGEALVRQGNAADAFYLLRSGRCALLEQTMDGHESMIAPLGPGSTFGDLALLEGTPHSATVRAQCAGQAFVMDAGVFQRLLAQTLTFSRSSPRPVRPVWTLAPFRHLEPAAVAELAAGGTWVRIAPGDHAIEQGATGDIFYVVARGQLAAERDGTVVGSLHAGDSFGETALLDDAPHTTTVRALTPTLLFVTSRALFDRVVRSSFQRTDVRTRLVASAGSATPPSQR